MKQNIFKNARIQFWCFVVSRNFLKMFCINSFIVILDRGRFGLRKISLPILNYNVDIKNNIGR
jgi:hypothetical protein